MEAENEELKALVAKAGAEMERHRIEVAEALQAKAADLRDVEFKLEKLHEDKKASEKGRAALVKHLEEVEAEMARQQSAAAEDAQAKAAERERAERTLKELQEDQKASGKEREALVEHLKDLQAKMARQQSAAAEDAEAIAAERKDV